MPSRSRPVVLMVDDDVDTREMYQWCLEARGFDVLSAGTAHQGFVLAKDHRPDAIVTDFTLPGEDGFQLASQLRAAEGPLADTPAVLVSGRAFVGGSGDTAMRLFDRVLLKPVLPDQLIESLIPLLLDRTTAQLDRQLRAVRSRLSAAPRTSDASRVLTTLNEVTAGETPAALLADSGAHYIDANDAACALTGRSRAELLSMRVWDLAARQKVSDAQAAWARFVEAGTLSGSYVLRNAQGGEIQARFAASAHVLPGCHLSLLQSVPPALTRDARP